MSVFFPRITLPFYKSASSKNKRVVAKLKQVARLDSGNQNQLKQLLEQPSPDVYLDLGQIRFMDTHAIRTLKQIQTQLETRGQQLHISHISDTARLTLELVGGLQ